MKRHLFNCGAAVSLLLCVGVCALWVATAVVGFRLDWGRVDVRPAPRTPSRTRYQLRVIGGQVELSRRTTTVRPEASTADADAYRRAFAAEDLHLRREREQDVTRPVKSFGAWGYPALPGHPTLDGAESVWAVHDWLLAAAFAALPATWLVRRQTGASLAPVLGGEGQGEGHEGRKDEG